MNEKENFNKDIYKEGEKSDKIQITKESMSLEKVKEATAEVTVNKDVEFFDEVLNVSIQKDDISIEHIPIGKVIEQYPNVREEGGKTIIPVVKEQIVVTKQLYLEKEIHISKNTTEEVQEVKETLRKDVVNIERKKL